MKKSLAWLLVIALVLALQVSLAEENVLYHGVLSYGNMTEEEADAYFGNLLHSKSEDTAHVETVASSAINKNKYYDDMNSALLGLQRGDVGFLVCPNETAEYIEAQNRNLYDAFDADMLYICFSLAVLDTNTELLEKLNAAIREMKLDGTLAILEAEYLADVTEQPDPVEIPTIEGVDTIRVLVTGDMPPMDCVTADGKAAGYNVALLRALSERIGMNIELVYANAGSRYINLTSGKADVVFWVSGFYNPVSAEFEFSADMPEGVAVTDWYNLQKEYVLLLAQSV